MGCCGGSSVKNDKFSTFSDACYNGNVEKMKETLAKEKASANAVNRVVDGQAPIHRAAQKGSVEAIKFLLDHNADPRQLSSKGETPLHVAAFHRNKEAVGALLLTAAKADVNTKDNQHGMTPLHVAVYRGCPEIAEALLKAGADPNIEDKEKAGLSSPSAQHQKVLALLEARSA